MKYTLNELRDTIVPMILSANTQKEAEACADEIVKLVQQNEEVKDAAS